MGTTTEKVVRLGEKSLDVAAVAIAIDDIGSRIGRLLDAARSNVKRIGEVEDVEWCWLGMGDLSDALRLSSHLRVEKLLREVRKEMNSLESEFEALMSAVTGEGGVEGVGAVDFEGTATHPSILRYTDGLEDVRRVYEVEMVKRRQAMEGLGVSFTELDEVVTAWTKATASKTRLRKWFATVAAVQEFLLSQPH